MSPREEHFSRNGPKFKRGVKSFRIFEPNRSLQAYGLSFEGSLDWGIERRSNPRRAETGPAKSHSETKINRESGKNLEMPTLIVVTALMSGMGLAQTSMNSFIIPRTFAPDFRGER